MVYILVIEILHTKMVIPTHGHNTCNLFKLFLLFCELINISSDRCFHVIHMFLTDLLLRNCVILAGTVLTLRTVINILIYAYGGNFFQPSSYSNSSLLPSDTVVAYV